MYARKLQDQIVTLGVSGMLWEGSLVMIDQETGSLWSHILGEAMRGPLEGTKLQTIPSLITDWENWKSRHPRSTVVIMRRTTGAYYRQLIRHDSGLIIGLATQEEARAWSFDILVNHPVVNDRLGEVAIVAVYDSRSRTATIYDRNVEGRELTFESRDGEMVDRQTGSRWDLITGIALSGDHAGKKLVRLPGLVSDSAAWQTYHMNSTDWHPTTNNSE